MGVPLQKIPSGKYSLEECVTALQQFQRDREEIPSRTAYMRWCVGKGLPSVASILFTINGSRVNPKRKTGKSKRKRSRKKAGGWANVLSVAGMDAKVIEAERRKKIARYTIEDCRDAVAKCQAAIGKVPLSTEYEAWHAANSGTPGYLTLVRLHDPDFPKRQRWSKALEMLGFVARKPESVRLSCRTGKLRTKDELIAAVHQCMAENHGDVPSSYVYDHWVEVCVAVGIDMPTSTTLRRQLGATKRRSSGEWRKVLRTCKLDPKLQSAKKRAQFASEQRERCLDSIYRFVEAFDGFGPLVTYLSWSMANDGASSLGSVFYWLAPETRSWNEVAVTAGISADQFVKETRIQRQQAGLTRVASKARCIAALHAYRAAHDGAKPSFLGFKIWRMNRPELPSEGELLSRLGGDRWNWSEVLVFANGSTT